MVRYSRQAFLLALAAFAIPACGKGGGDDSSSSSSTGGSGGGGTGSSNSLLKEDFDGAFPGTTWSAPFSTGSGTSMTIDSTTGDPALRMTTTAAPSFIGTTTTTTYTSRPITCSVRVSATGTGEGSGGIAILDHLGASIAAAEWHAATPSALTFRILSTTNPTPVAVPLAGSGFHTFAFTVTGAGEASWMLDGTVVMTRSGFPSDMVSVQLYDNAAAAGASFAVFRFDDVAISSP